MQLGSCVAVAVVQAGDSTALIPSLAWELPYALDVALQGKKNKKQKQRERDSLSGVSVVGQCDSAGWWECWDRLDSSPGTLG